MHRTQTTHLRVEESQEILKHQWSLQEDIIQGRKLYNQHTAFSLIGPTEIAQCQKRTKFRTAWRRMVSRRINRSRVEDSNAPACVHKARAAVSTKGGLWRRRAGNNAGGYPSSKSIQWMAVRQKPFDKDRHRGTGSKVKSGIGETCDASMA